MKTRLKAAWYVLRGYGVITGVSLDRREDGLGVGEYVYIIRGWRPANKLIITDNALRVGVRWERG
jgi:hypothetical protein